MLIYLSVNFSKILILRVCVESKMKLSMLGLLISGLSFWRGREGKLFALK